MAAVEEAGAHLLVASWIVLGKSNHEPPAIGLVSGCAVVI